MNLDPWLEKHIVCPVDHLPLTYDGLVLHSPKGREYPVVNGVPVMLVEDVEQTMGIASASLRRARDPDTADMREPELYLESLGISENEKAQLIELTKRQTHKIDPVVAFLIGATSGHSYKHLIGRLSEYPIPDLRLPPADDDILLDLGCNWGRWSIAAAQKGYKVIGVDPSLGAVMAARRVAEELRLPIHYVVGDARFLPLAKHSINMVFSYSVLQHFAKSEVVKAVEEIARVLRPGGTSRVQMPNFLGIRCLYHQLRRGFRAPESFEVRYWSIPELKEVFSHIGPTTHSVDCFFGLGLQSSDSHLMPLAHRLLVNASEGLRLLSRRAGVLTYAADSVYLVSLRPQHGAAT